MIFLPACFPSSVSVPIRGVDRNSDPFPRLLLDRVGDTGPKPPLDHPAALCRFFNYNDTFFLGEVS